jgi:hypothetical protein
MFTSGALFAYNRGWPRSLNDLANVVDTIGSRPRRSRKSRPVLLATTKSFTDSLDYFDAYFFVGVTDFRFVGGCV